jgi:hypothetical protein
MRHAEQMIYVVTPLLHGPQRGRGARRVAQQFPSRGQCPGAALDTLDVCVGVCCRAGCTAVAPGAGRLVAHGMEDAASSSTRKPSGMKSWCSTMWTMVSSSKTSKNLKPKPLPGAPNVGEEILRPGGGTHPP